MSPAVAVARPAAGILVEAVERVLHAAIGADREDGGAESLEVLGQKAPPEVLTERHEEHRADDGERVPLEREQVAHAAEPAGRVTASAESRTVGAGSATGSGVGPMRTAHHRLAQ